MFSGYVSHGYHNNEIILGDQGADNMAGECEGCSTVNINVNGPPNSPPLLKGFPDAEYMGTTKNGRWAWKWGTKWLEWTEKGGGVVEMYDYKTKKKYKGKYDPNTGKQLKKPNKPRFADVIKFGLNRVRLFPLIIFEPAIWLFNESNNNNYHQRNLE